MLKYTNFKKGEPNLKKLKNCLDNGGHYIYPCSIYLRYNGNPIAKATDPFYKQQEKTIDFIEKKSCVDDDICINFCTRCTRDYNLYCNLKMEKPCIAFESNQPKSCDIIIDKPCDKYVNKSQNIYSNILEYANKNFNPKPFIVLKNKYLPEKLDFLNFYFDSLKIEEYKIIELNNWNYISLFIYAKHQEEEKLPMERFLVNQAHDIIYGEKALLILFNNIEFNMLKKMKQQLRDWFGTVDIKLTSTTFNKIITTKGNCCHSPDKDNLEYEWGVLNYFIHDKITN